MLVVIPQSVSNLRKRHVYTNFEHVFDQKLVFLLARVSKLHVPAHATSSHVILSACSVAGCIFVKVRIRGKLKNKYILLIENVWLGSTKAKKVEVYHCTSSTRNPFMWEKVMERVDMYLHSYPLKSAVWYPTLKFLPSITLFKISAIFVHFLPALLLDTVTQLSGGRPM